MDAVKLDATCRSAPTLACRLEGFHDPRRTVLMDGAATYPSVMRSTTERCASQPRSIAANTRRSANSPAPPRITHPAAGIHAPPNRGLTCRLVIARDEGNADASNRTPTSTVRRGLGVQ